MRAADRAHDKTLADVRDDIIRAGAWVTCGIVAATFCAVAFIFLATPYYTARMIVSPAAAMSGSGDSAPAGSSYAGSGYQAQRGGFNGEGEFVRFENMLAGPSAAAKLLQDEKILRGLSFDKNFGFSGAEAGWTAEKLAEYIDRRVRVEPIGGTLLRRLVYLHPNPEFGVYFLHRLHRAVDDMIRTKVRDDAAERVSYLQRASEETANPDHRRALTILLLEQERLRMLASIDQPYAAAIVEPPASSSQPQWPDALLIVPVLMFAGALLGFLAHGAFARRRPEPFSFTVSRKAWFRPDSTNMNERRLGHRKTDDSKAAE